jgi:hypothetical protein
MYFVEDWRAEDLTLSQPRKSRHSQIAETAYFLSQARGFAPGREFDDWLAAEREIDARRRDEAHRRYAHAR